MAKVANWLTIPPKPSPPLGFPILTERLTAAKGWLKGMALAGVSQGWLNRNPRHCWFSGHFSQLAILATLSPPEIVKCTYST